MQGGVRFCDGGKPITRVAVGGGACGKLLKVIGGTLYAARPERQHIRSAVFPASVHRRVR